MEPIEITMQPRLEEFREAYRALAPRAVSLGYIAIACVVLFVLEMRQLSDTLLVGAVLAVTACTAVLFGRSAYAALVRMPARAFAFLTSTAPVSYMVDESGITATTTLGTAHNVWAAFKRLIETTNTLLLVGHNGFLYIIPKRDAPTERLAELQALLQRTLGKKTPTA
jgi:hypothetical protein